MPSNIFRVEGLKSSKDELFLENEPSLYCFFDNGIVVIRAWVIAKVYFYHKHCIKQGLLRLSIFFTHSYVALATYRSQPKFHNAAIVPD